MPRLPIRDTDDASVPKAHSPRSLLEVCSSARTARIWRLTRTPMSSR